MSDIQVRMRTSEDSTAVPFTSVPYGTVLEDVLTYVGRRGIYTEHGEFDTSALVGQFVVEPGAAYFEIIVDVDGDA